MRHAPHRRHKHCRISAPKGALERAFLHRRGNRKGYSCTENSNEPGIPAPTSQAAARHSPQTQPLLKRPAVSHTRAAVCERARALAPREPERKRAVKGAGDPRWSAGVPPSPRIRSGPIASPKPRLATSPQPIAGCAKAPSTPDNGALYRLQRTPEFALLSGSPSVTLCELPQSGSWPGP